MCLDHGIFVDQYRADNGVFKANSFVQHIREKNQVIRYCGVNGHHQNGVAERAIRTVSDMTRAMLFHASSRWKDGIDSSLWPMANSYAAYIYNHMPDSTTQLAPADLFSGQHFPRHKLKDMHVWGCPVYVLDPTLQKGSKLPKWQPRSRRGIFVGFSPAHSSDVPLILNTQTGHISPQFHVVFDDNFSTVNSLTSDDEPPPFWNDFDIGEFLYRIELDDDAPASLSSDWLTPSEVEEKERARVRSVRLQNSSSSTGKVSVPSSVPSLPSGGVPARSSLPGGVTPSPSVGTPAVTNGGVHPALSSSPPSVPVVPPIPSASQPRRSTRASKGLYTSTKFQDEVYCASLDPSLSPQDEILAYQAAVETDVVTGLYNCSDPRAYAASHKLKDPDTPSIFDALHGDDKEEYREAMKKEITQLLKQKTWERIPRDQVPPKKDGTRRRILKGTWAFKLKRLPDGTPSKHKARYCVRGDLQTEGVDFFETYAPVVQWSTVRLALTMILSNGWKTKQVDYTNAFAQAELNEEVYIDEPQCFTGKGNTPMVLRLLKSLYGLRQAPKTFFDKLKAGLLERGFIQSQLDPCLFMKRDMICLIYVDDTIIAGPDSAAIDREIHNLGVSNDEQHHQFELRDEGEVGDFLGIRIEKLGPRKFNLTQTGLINKVLKAANMTDCNSVGTPAVTTALGSDKDGNPFSEDWEYATVLGMLMYLASNSRPEIAYAVHQCARFTHAPRNSHAVAIKRILRYLQGTRDKGLVFNPSTSLQVDCYVDADFAGLWSIEDEQDPVSVKSRTGFLLMFMNCPLLWVSKLQTQIALSTMEAEYIALSASMRELIGTREIIKEIQTFVLNGKLKPPKCRTHSKAFVLDSIPQSKVYEDNEACLKFASMPKMSPRTKHIAIPYHFFRSKVQELEIEILPIGTTNQLADQFTKGLVEVKFVSARKALMGW